MRKLKKASPTGKEVALYEAHTFGVGGSYGYGGDGDFQAAGGNSETGGGNCGVTIDDFQVTGGFEHGKSCPSFL